MATDQRTTHILDFSADWQSNVCFDGSWVTANEARGAALEILAQTKTGVDPRDADAKRKAEPVMTELGRRFLEEYVPTHCKASTHGEYRRSVELFIDAAIGQMWIAEVERKDVAKLHFDLRDKPYQANRTFGVLSKMFSLAEIWGLRPDGSNPCRHVKRYKENKRERFLSPEETERLGEVLREAESEMPSAAAAFRLLLLTGCRLSEIQFLRWEHVKNACIELPEPAPAHPFRKTQRLRSLAVPAVGRTVRLVVPHQALVQHVIRRFPRRNQRVRAGVQPSARSTGGPPVRGRRSRARSGTGTAARSRLRRSRGGGELPGHDPCRQDGIPPVNNRDGMSGGYSSPEQERPRSGRHGTRRSARMPRRRYSSTDLDTSRARHRSWVIDGASVKHRVVVSSDLPIVWLRVFVKSGAMT